MVEVGVVPWSDLMAFCMEIERGLLCLRKVMLGLIRLSMSLYSSGPGLRVGKRSWKMLCHLL